MIDREKQIEKIVEILKNGDDFCVDVGGKDCDTCSPNRQERCTVRKQAQLLYDNGYRKMDEVTLKLDLGDRTPEEIKQIAEMFNGEIKKQVAKEILRDLRKDISQCYGDYALEIVDDYIESYGVEVDE